MNIALVSHTYPTLHDPSSGIFIQKEAHLIHNFAHVEIHIPSVYATFLNKQYYRNQNPVDETFPIHLVKYLSFPQKKLPVLTQKSLSRKLLQSLNSKNIDLVHLHWLYPIGLAIPALKKAGYPVVITLHGGDWYYNVRNNSLMQVLKKSLHASDVIVTVGKQLKADIMEYLPEVKDKTHHVPHAIDTNKFKPSESKSNLKKKLEWHNHQFNILCVANLYRIKGIHLLIQAFAEQRFFPDCHLHIVSPRSDSEAKKVVAELIKNLGISDNITFYPSMPEKELILLFQAADLYVSPSLKEGFGLAVAEAAACGTPVLATRSGGPEEIITEETGHLVEVNSVNALANGIELLLPKLKEFNPKQMNQKFQKAFGLERKKKQLKDIYNSIL